MSTASDVASASEAGQASVCTPAAQAAGALAQGFRACGWFAAAIDIKLSLDDDLSKQKRRGS